MKFLHTKYNSEWKEASEKFVRHILASRRDFKLNLAKVPLTNARVEKHKCLRQHSYKSVVQYSVHSCLQCYILHYNVVLSTKQWRVWDKLVHIWCVVSLIWAPHPLSAIFVFIHLSTPHSQKTNCQNPRNNRVGKRIENIIKICWGNFFLYYYLNGRKIPNKYKKKIPHTGDKESLDRCW